jgi:hypothetical protein
MRHTEPPSCSKPTLFFIGKNGRGNWVVQDQRGARGGLFVERVDALRFALFENGNRPQAVVMVPGIFELDLGRKEQPANQAEESTAAYRKRRAA